MLKEFLLHIYTIAQINSEIYETLLTIYFTLATTFFASGLSVLTLSIAFISGKKDILKQITIEIENNGSSLSLAKKKDSAINFIRNMKKITNLAIATMGISIISLLLCIIFFFKYCPILIHVVSILTIISLSFLITSISILCRWYYKMI